LLNEQTLTQLKSLRLDGMLAALTDQAISSAAADLGFDDRVAMLVQREIDWRDDKRLTRLLKAARLKVSGACIEDIKWRASRNLDRNLIASLASCDWVRHARTVLMTGSTGTGKTWLSCALAQQAARSGLTVLYTRTTRLMQELHVAHGDGSFGRRLAQLARIDLLVLDDFAGAPMEAGERTDLLELLDDRVGSRATLITSQLAVNVWHAWLDDPTVADAILDRIVHSSHRIALKGPSLRKEDGTNAGEQT
jgi:DNA replication protein DnaC